MVPVIGGQVCDVLHEEYFTEFSSDFSEAQIITPIL